MKNAFGWGVVGLCLLTALLACNNPSSETANPNEKATPNVAATQNIPSKKDLGLFGLVSMEGASHTLILADFFPDPNMVDSITGPPGLDIQISADGKEAALKVVGDVPPVFCLAMYVDGEVLSMPIRTSNKKDVTLRLRDKGYQKVQVKGEMNSWNAPAGGMTLRKGIWEYTFRVVPGDYQYLFVIDEKEEIRDPKNPNTAPNGFGGSNSVLKLKRPTRNALPELHTKAYRGQQITLSAPKASKVIAFWENQELPVDLEQGEAIFDIPDAAVDYDRTHLRAFAYNEYGLANDILIPLQSGKVLTDAADLNRFDKEAQVMYFTLIDRFNNGNTNNDAPLNDPKVEGPADYYGGDIKGITQKIQDGYFTNLGINAIWLSPITQNPEEAYQEYIEPQRWYSGYHGYWPIYSNKVDHRFGTDAELRELVNVAHENDINILLDFVCNHVHELHPIYQKHPEYATQLDLGEGRRNLRLFDEERLTTWFDTFLPSLDFSKQEVIELQADSAMYWIKEYGMDGYRHDAAKHIPIPFWRHVTRKLKEDVVWGEGRPLYQIGETYGSRELINTYIGSGLMDSQFDFEIFNAVSATLINEELGFTDVAESLEASFEYFGHHNSMGYISGNHDKPRFISLAGGDLKTNEDGRAAGWEREVGVGDPIGYNRLQVLHAFNASIPGVPVIYYGDEIGIPGANDPDSRRMMRFENWSSPETETQAFVESVMQLRRNQLSLTYGDTEILSVDDDHLIILRKYFGEVTIAVLYEGAEPQTLSFQIPEELNKENWETHFPATLKVEGTQITVEMSPVSANFILNTAN
ncbi:MAG: alpha-amylase family glycosyl hydrolase [Bacteroidota bacterium]